MLHKHKLITSLLLIAALVFTSAGAVFADTTPQTSTQTIVLTPEDTAAAGDVTPYYVYQIKIGTERISSTSGQTGAAVTFSGLASSYTIKATLQENYNGSWRTATGVSPTTDSTSGTNATSAMLVSTWTLQSSKAYRVSVYVKDVIGGTTYTGTYNSDSF